MDSCGTPWFESCSVDVQFRMLTDNECLKSLNEYKAIIRIFPVFRFLTMIIFSEMLQQGELSSSMESLSYDSSVTSPASSNGHNNQRTKRMRTSFKHHQLRTMKTYFAINQNPDAKDLKQLAQKTGLSKRVLQVGIFLFLLWHVHHKALIHEFGLDIHFIFCLKSYM